MTLSASVVGVQDVKAMLEQLGKMPKDGVDWLRIAGRAKTIITDRTKVGVDVRGQVFSPYSESYLVYKEKRTGKINPKVNLDDKGNMFGGMIPERSGLGARLFFAEPERKKAQGHDSGDGNNPQRQFFSIAEPEADILISDAENDIDEYMAKL